MSEAIEAELVLVALGARARIELAESAGIEAENGAIVVELGASSLEPRPIADSERTVIVRIGGLGVAMRGRMLML